MYKTKDYFTLTKVSNGVWYYYAYDEGGRRIRRSTGRRSRKEAEKEVFRRINEGILIQRSDDISVLKKQMTFSEFAEPFWIWDSCPIIRDKLARGGHYSADLCASNRHSMEKHIIPYFGSMALSSLTRRHIDHWILNLPKDHGISPSTANKMLSILKQMLRVAVYDGLLMISPAETVKPLIETEKRRGAFTEKEIGKLFSMKWESSMAYTACFLAAFTGMRLGEIRALRPSRVHEDYILVDSSWSDMGGLKSTKSGKPRVVPITKRIHTMISRLSEGRADDELIFSFNGSVPCEDRKITGPLKEAMAKAGIDIDGRSLTFHSFRHFFNTQIVAAGISGEIVRNVVGHESEDMTDRYLHLGSAELEAVRDVQLDLTRTIRRDRI